MAELCRRLDGVPLAIELAAARTRSLSAAEITARLGDRFALLAGSSRVSDQRHRSLKDLVDWSYQLLEPVEQQLFRRLSIFAGSFDLDAAEHVCGYGDVPPNMVASVLAVLVDKSMVQAFTGTRTTYRLLETLREFGAALDEGEAPQIARRHGAWILDICERGPWVCTVPTSAGGSTHSTACSTTSASPFGTRWMPTISTRHWASSWPRVSTRSGGCGTS